MDKHSVNNLLIKINNNSLGFLDDYILMIEKEFKVNINVHDVVGTSSLAYIIKYEREFNYELFH